MYSTDAEYGQLVKTLNDLAECACVAHIQANAGHPSVAKIAELKTELGRIQTWLKIAVARLALMETGLEIDERRGARQPVFFNVDPYADGGPYAKEGGRK